MASKFKTDASWIRKTLRRKSIREFREAKKRLQSKEKIVEELELPDSAQNAENPGNSHRASLAERRATLAEKQMELREKRRASKKELDAIRAKKNSKTMRKGKTLRKRKTLRSPSKKMTQLMEIVKNAELEAQNAAENVVEKVEESKMEEMEIPEEVETTLSSEKVDKVKEIIPVKQEIIEVKEEVAEKKEGDGGEIKEEVADVEDDDVEGYDEEEETEYETEYDSEEEDESEEDDMAELNEMNFNKLLQIRVQTTDHQLEAFCTKYVFVLKKEGVRELHELADEFELVCRQVYEPMLLKNAPRKRKGTLRKNVDLAEMKAALKIPKEFPVEHEHVVDFFIKHNVVFDSSEERTDLFSGLHIMENCCFFQFCLLKYRDLILDQHCERWEKTRDELEGKNYGSLILEEFFMPPMKVEPKLDTELVKFSKLMSNRQFEINQFKRKMIQKEPNSVAFNILKNELHKYIKELEEKIKISEIYFAAAIMKVKQKQQRELDRVYDLIDAEDEAEAEAGNTDENQDS